MSELSKNGWERRPNLLTSAECAALRALYVEPEHFRSRIEMARYRFGEGDYQYFAYPLPPAVQRLRETLYAELAPVANVWNPAFEYPPTLAEYLELCHVAGQTRPTPLLLRYGVGGHNCLHQDLYGALAFPFQVVVSLASPGEDFTGGELILVEQRYRAQSKAQALLPTLGEGIIFANRKAVRGNMKHGVSPVVSGERFTLGVIFHDAE